MELSRLEEVFHQAQRLSLAECDEMLARECAGNAGLASKVRELLAIARRAETKTGNIVDPFVAVRSADSIAAPVPERNAPKSTLPVGTVLNSRYRIEKFLAAGGMGQVYKVWDLELGVPLALKAIRSELAADSDALRRFKQEVLLARSISHPDVCRIFELGRDETTNTVFLTMEFLEGETLASRIDQQGALSKEDSIPLVRNMTDALDAAHRAGVIHRDFKSPNVMLVPSESGNRAVIMDFGLAVTVGHGEGPESGSELIPGSLTANESATTLAAGLHPSRIVGTPAYMSPEQAAGGRVGPASDLYALGIVLFEMSTGRVPFRGDSPLATIQAQLTDEPPRPSELADVDRVWDQTILRLLSKKPTDRYASANDVLHALAGRANGDRAVPHVLPAERDAFVGRRAELDAVAAHLEGSDGEKGTRLLTLQGAGGTGKTRLSQKYGWESLIRWSGGVWFCDLSEARSIDGVAQAVAGALDVPLGKGDPIVQLGNVIAGRGRSLLILDNFEQVTEHADATLGCWLERTTEARFLVTTRERLGLSEEVIHALDPLDPTTQGVELFEVRGWGHRPGFLVDDTNRGRVEEIVQKLDGLPLAIEMAAARLRMMSLEQLAAGSANRFPDLAGGKPGRHATLSATVDWSWELLERWEQSVIAQFSVFEGGFTLEAAEAVIDLDSYSGAPLVLDVIQSLVDKSWLRAKVALGAPHFSMYMTLQEYASAKLQATESASLGVQARHGAYFGKMGADDSIAGLNGHGGTELRAALCLEIDNLVAACRWAIVQQNEAVAATSYLAAHTVLAMRGPFLIAIRLGRDVLTVLSDAEQRASTLVALARVEQLAAMMNEAREHAEEALRISRAAGLRRQEGGALAGLGTLSFSQGRFDPAREHWEAALSIARELGDKHLEGKMLINLGGSYQQHARMNEARAHYEMALAIHREEGDRRSEGIGLGHLGLLLHRLRRLDEAREHWEAALAIHREVGNRNFEGHELGNLGVSLRLQGRMEDAREHFEAALAIHREVGNRRSEGIALGDLGVIHQRQSQFEEARDCFVEALAVHREVGNRRTEGIVLGNLGALDQTQGRLEDAQGYFESALVIAREADDGRFEGLMLRELGAVHKAQGQIAKGRERLEEGEALLRAVDDSVELGTLSSESELARRIEKTRRAVQDSIRKPT